MPITVLYSFRRCPYAMRARMAIAYSGVTVELREVLLKNKPQALLQASPKGTVPVVVLDNGQVIDESLDIMKWALSQHDPDRWLQQTADLDIKSQQLIAENDGEFKTHLDHYKYADRYPQHNADFYRAQGEVFLARLEQYLKHHPCLLTNKPGFTDIAIFPFIRQFALVDMDWFQQAPYPRLQHWLQSLLGCTLFASIMDKQVCWEPGQAPVYLSTNK